MTEWQCVYYTLTNVVTLADGRIFYFFWLTWYKLVPAISDSRSCCWAYIWEASICVSKHISVQKYWAFLQQLPQNLHRSIRTWWHQTFTLSEHSFEVRQSQGKKKSKINNKFHIQCILSGHQSSFLKMEWRKCRIGASFGKMFGIR